jgi:hypothetical protein
MTVRERGKSRFEGTEVQPGPTEISPVRVLTVRMGLSFGELVKWIVANASLDRSARGVRRRV